MRMLLRTLFFSSVFAGAQVHASSASDFTELGKLIEKTKRATNHQTGTAIAVVKDGKVIYQGYFGFADIEREAPVDSDTVFYIASATKPFFALNALLQEHKGTLSTATSLPAMFPDLAFKRFDAKAVSLRHLLTHTSGLDNQPLAWATAFTGIHDATSRLQLVAQTYPDSTAARDTFRYTNVGYNIASVWLDQQVKMPWQQQLEANVFRPLGMLHTSAYISEAEAKKWLLARPYSVMSTNRNQALYLEKSDATMQAAGGMIATAPDLARFLIAELNGGKIAGKQVLPRQVVGKSQQQQTKTDGKGYEDFARDGYTWGWYQGQYKGRRMLHHFGGFAGFHAHLSFIPEASVGLVILNNEDFLAGKLSNLIADYAYGVALLNSAKDAKPGHDSPAQRDALIQAVSARFDALIEKATGLDATVADQEKILRERQWQLSLPRSAYAGTYTHTLSGDITIELDADDQLTLQWGRLRAVVRAYSKKDCVRVELIPISGQVVEFQIENQSVIGVLIDGMQFDRQRP